MVQKGKGYMMKLFEKFCLIVWLGNLNSKKYIENLVIPNFAGFCMMFPRE